MTYLGTRPILPDELEQYELHHRARIAIKPGITGMWQVSGRSDITDFEEIDYLVLHDRHEDLEDVVIKMGSKKLIASADEISNKWLRGFVRWYRLYRVFKDNDIS